MAYGYVLTVNRTTRPLDVRWDGTPYVLPPGYVRVPVVDPEGRPKVDRRGQPVTEVLPATLDGRPNRGGPPCGVPLPAVVADAAKRQHPILGTEDPYNLDPRSTQYLVGVPEWGDECSHVEQSSALERLDRSKLDESRRRVVALRPAGTRTAPVKEGPGRPATTGAARGLPGTVDQRLVNPAGIRVGGGE
jgi:hypothetical protein